MEIQQYWLVGILLQLKMQFLVFLRIPTCSINTLVHQPSEKLREVPSETSVKKCVTVDKPHHILAIKSIFRH